MNGTMDFGYSDGDVDTNRSGAGGTLGELIERRYSRRDALRGGTSAAAAAVFGGSILAACGSDGVAADAAPTVSVGATGATSTGSRVVVNATATDNGTVATTAFSQVSGPAVTLSATSDTTTSFIAPSVTSATPVVLRYAAVDDRNQTSFTDTTITIQPATLSFAAVAKNKLDIVSVPAGNTATVLYRLGDPISGATAAYRNDGTDTDFANRAGDHHDALHFFGLTATVGKAPDTALKRFLVGPVECEITGVDSTPDGRTLFVNIQHPGENGGPANITSNWPASQTGAAPGNRPRSATVVIQRTDGGVVGL